MTQQGHAHQDRHARSSNDSATLTMRPRVAADDARIVEIHGLQEADSAPVTIARYRAEHDEKVGDHHGEQWVAVERSRVVGAGSFATAWWTGRPGTFTVDIRIDQSSWRRGIGTELYVTLRSRLVASRASRLLAWIRADAEGGRAFAARHGFRETAKVMEEYRLRVGEATTEAYAGLAECLGREGLRIASLAELGTADEAFLRALHALWADSGDEPPERLRGAFPAWRREVLDAPGVSPRTHWVALDGECPVGMTFLKRLSADAAENDYTGVASSHRGRGIAPALKLRAIAWARQQGVSWFYTSSEVKNTRMIGINRRLGYQPGARRLEVARDLPA